MSAVDSCNHEEVEDKAFLREWEESSAFQALVLYSTSPTLDVSSEQTTQQGTIKEIFFVCFDGSCLTQVIKELVRRSALLDLRLANKEELVGGVEVAQPLL